MSAKRAQAKAVQDYISRLTYRIDFLETQARDAASDGESKKARRYREVANNAREERALAIMTANRKEE